MKEPSRLERLAVDIHDHYVSACANDPERVQKAMVVCSNRPIAYEGCSKYSSKYRVVCREKTPGDVTVSDEEMRRLKPMPFMAMVASVGSNDPAEMYQYLGGVKTASGQRNWTLRSSRTSPTFGSPSWWTWITGLTCRR